MDQHGNTTTTSNPKRRPESQNRYTQDKPENQRNPTQCPCQINSATQHPEQRVRWLRNLATAIKQIKNHREFREISPSDSIKTISKKLHFIFDQIRKLTRDADILSQSIWMDIWEVIAKFMAKGPGRTEKERTDAKRDLFMILNETTKAEPLDLQGWLSTEPEQQIMQLIKQVHPWDNKNQENPTSATLDNTDWVVPKIEHGDSIETFKVKARIFITNLESNLSQDNVNYEKNLTAAMQSFLQKDQSWMAEMQEKATTTRPGQAILRNNSTRKASPDEIEQWLILMWHEHLKNIAQQEEVRNIEFDRRTRVQPSDSKQQVQRKVYQALRRAEPIKGGIINNGGMDSDNSAQAIFSLENLLSVDQSWMPQLRAIAASATRNPNALQRGIYEQISYRDIQEWVDTL